MKIGSCRITVSISVCHIEGWGSNPPRTAKRLSEGKRSKV